MGEHTKLPWCVVGDVWQPWLGAIQINGADGEIIAYTTSGTNEKFDAPFIVKAVNSHDALVEALEFIRDGYANQDVNHVDYRVKVYQVALDALASVTT